MKNNKICLMSILVILIIGVWLCFKTAPVVIIFTSSFANTEAKILLNDKTVLDTVLNSDASTGFTMSHVINASITDKIVLNIDSFKFIISPNVVKSRYLIKRLNSDSVYIKKLDKSEKLEFY